MSELLLRVVTNDTDSSSIACDEARDVIVAAEPEHSVGELTTAVAACLGSTAPDFLVSVRTGQTLYADIPLADIDLVSGDEISFADHPGHDARQTPPPCRAVAVDVIAGPDSGRSQFLAPGRTSIGRSSTADFVIDDASVSRHHVTLGVSTDWQVTVEPTASSANGVFVNDVEITGPTVITGVDVIGLGGTRLAVRPFERGDRRHVDRLGQLDFHRTPYRPPVVEERVSEPIGPIPTRPDPRRFQMLAGLAPLGAGLVMYAFTRQIQFLALTLISPIVMIASSIDERRSGRRSFGAMLVDFRAALADRRKAFEAMRHVERAERLRAAPDVADLARRAELRTIDLWSRGRQAPDFLHLRLGLATDAVRFPIELERGGDDDLRHEALAAMAGLDTIDHVPITVDLATESLGVHGAIDLVEGVANSLLIQAVTLHSPEDLIVLAAVSPGRQLRWMKWLPHLRSVTSPVPGNHLATDTDEANSLIGRLIEVATFRTAARHLGDRCQGEHSWPRLLLVLDTVLGIDPAETSRLADLAPAADISIVWLTPCAADVPRHATRILAVRRDVAEAMVARLWATDPKVADRDLEVEHLRPDLAERIARSLAPIRDASTASLATSIPRVAPLLDVLGVGKPDADWVAGSWATHGGYSLRFPIGVGVDGPLELDLVHDGPHTLIGGTSGAGKSELLQSMVAGLAARYSPERLNLLFVDYKGGASSQVFERLPHTVGYVTNLSAALSLRALASLRAELNRRMAVMEGRAKDLAEMLERFPDEAPASLVIIVDEFATLVNEVPEFVAGVIDIAQRGRSLGIHLVLATQRPSGSVNENILANTNLRVSLRMLDRSESTAIIGSPDAADIPVPLRGRGLARLGPRRLVEFQSSFAGAPLASTAVRQPVLVARFDRTDDSPRAVTVASTAATVSHLDALVDAILAANDVLSVPTPRRPWREVLPDSISLDSVLDEAGFDAMTDAGRFVTIGMLDAPERQEQRPAVIDLEEGGGWLIFGSGGAGKTTVLRTVAASISAIAGAGEVAMLGLDFASRGLTGLRALPEMIDVTSGDDLEAVTRHLAVLDAELDRRRRLLADAGAESLTAFRRDDASVAMPRIVLLIDGFGGLMNTLTETGGGLMSNNDQWIEIVQRLVIDGRQAGIHAVVTADRRNAVPSRLHAAVANRLILRHAEDTSYTEHGIKLDTARQLDQIPGRGLIDGSTLVQVACPAVGDHSARAQNAAISELADRLGRPPTATLMTSPLRETISGLGTTEAELTVPLGVADVTGRVVEVDLAWSHLAVCGPTRSGRSTALATVVAALQAGADHELFVVGQASSPLAAVAGERSVFGRAEQMAPFLDRLANQVAMGPGECPRVLVVDDVDRLDDPSLAMIWERLASLDDLRIVMSLESRSMSGYTSSAMVNVARRARRLLVLQPDDPTEFLQLTGSKLSLRLGLRLPVGRGVLLVDRQPTTLQVALPHRGLTPR